MSKNPPQDDPSGAGLKRPGHGQSQGHGHSHGHSHGHGLGHSHGSGGSITALKWALILNGLFLLIEGAIGFYTGSLALLSDAAHMVSDVSALALALGAAHLARRPPSAFATFGLGRVEVLGGFINALLLLPAIAYIYWEAFERLQSPAGEIQGIPVLIAGVIGLIINLGSAYFLMKGDTQNLNIRGALIHMLADALGSVGAIIASVGLIYGLAILDPIISLVIGAIVLVGTYGLLRDTTRVLLQLSPSGMANDAVQGVIQGIPGVQGIHDLHIWSLDGQKNLMSAHVVAQGGQDLHALRKQVKKAVQSRFGIDHTTIQMEGLDDRRCGQCPCPLQNPGDAQGGGGESNHVH